MKIILDASVIVEIDRRNKQVIDVIKTLVSGDHTILISTITLSEILTGPYLRKDLEKSLYSAKTILGQFRWINFDPEIAQKTAQYLAFLITEGKMIEYQDVAVAATCKITECDYLITLNKSHFERIPDLKQKIVTPDDTRFTFFGADKKSKKWRRSEDRAK